MKFVQKKAGISSRMSKKFSSGILVSYQREARPLAQFYEDNKGGGVRGDGGGGGGFREA
jgi:hypothetical protein